MAQVYKALQKKSSGIYTLSKEEIAWQIRIAFRKSLDYFEMLFKIVGMNRMQIHSILKDLKSKMVFLMGPRQVGKTWLAKEVMTHYKRPLYLNYDFWESRALIQKQTWPVDTDLIVFDELHKMKEWKNYLKGLYDTKPVNLHILVTGSARLDTFRQSGDSLAGRFFIHHLMPLSPAECFQTNQPFLLEDLIIRGGFPEPYLADTEVDAQRWRTQYLDGLIRDDVMQLDLVQSLKTMQLLVELLRHRVGSLISYEALGRDLAVSGNTVKRYLEILEALYIVFRVTPYSKNIARSLLKTPKFYFYDTGLVLGGEGEKYENFVAVCLLKHVFAKYDYEGVSIRLQYLRTKEGKELDFCFVEHDTLIEIIEAKLTDNKASSFAHGMSQDKAVPLTWLVKNLRYNQDVQGVQIRSAKEFLEALSL